MKLNAEKILENIIPLSGGRGYHGFNFIQGVNQALYGKDYFDNPAFHGPLSFLDDLKKNLATLTTACGYAELGLGGKVGARRNLLLDAVAYELAILFKFHFDKPPTSTPGGQFINFLAMGLGWVTLL